MNRAVENLVRRCGVDLVRAAKFTSTNAARAMGLDSEIGSIALGHRANLAVLDDDYECITTFVDGRLVFEKGAFEEHRKGSQKPSPSPSGRGPG
jgi:N-acetylglucosamine-6-phosphate deacetylase